MGLLSCSYLPLVWGVVRILRQAWQATGRMASRKTVFSWSPVIVVLLRILFWISQI